MKRFVAAILAASLVAVAVVPAGATASSTGSQNIVQVASSLPQFTELVKLVKAAGLVSALEGQVEADRRPPMITPACGFAATGPSASDTAPTCSFTGSRISCASKPSGMCPPAPTEKRARTVGLLAPVRLVQDKDGSVSGVVQDLDVDWLGPGDGRRSPPVPELRMLTRRTFVQAAVRLVNAGVPAYEIGCSRRTASNGPGACDGAATAANRVRGYPAASSCSGP